MHVCMCVCMHVCMYAVLPVDCLEEIIGGLATREIEAEIERAVHLRAEPAITRVELRA